MRRSRSSRCRWSLRSHAAEGSDDEVDALFPTQVLPAIARPVRRRTAHRPCRSASRPIARRGSTPDRRRGPPPSAKNVFIAVLTAAHLVVVPRWSARSSTSSCPSRRRGPAARARPRSSSRSRRRRPCESPVEMSSAGVEAGVPMPPRAGGPAVAGDAAAAGARAPLRARRSGRVVGLTPAVQPNRERCRAEQANDCVFVIGLLEDDGAAGELEIDLRAVRHASTCCMRCR